MAYCCFQYIFLLVLKNEKCLFSNTHEFLQFFIFIFFSIHFPPGVLMLWLHFRKPRRKRKSPPPLRTSPFPLSSPAPRGPNGGTGGPSSWPPPRRGGGSRTSMRMRITRTAMRILSARGT